MKNKIIYLICLIILVLLFLLNGGYYMFDIYRDIATIGDQQYFVWSNIHELVRSDNLTGDKSVLLVGRYGFSFGNNIFIWTPGGLKLIKLQLDSMPEYYDFCSNNANLLRNIYGRESLLPGPVSLNQFLSLIKRGDYVFVTYDINNNLQKIIAENSEYTLDLKEKSGYHYCK